MYLIASSNRNYDLFINSKRILSFNDVEYKEGQFGLLIGPETRVSIDQISVNNFQETTAIAEPNNDFQNNIILKLKEENEKLKNENDELENVVETMKASRSSLRKLS